MSGDPLGFIGLGNMGSHMAANVSAAGHDLVAFDLAGTLERAPQQAKIASSCGEIAECCATVLLCLPDGPAVLSVVDEIEKAQSRKTTTVVDHSTIGIKAAREAANSLFRAGINYLDAPVELVAAANTPVPFAPALENAHLPTVEKIVLEGT